MRANARLGSRILPAAALAALCLVATACGSDGHPSAAATRTAPATTSPTGSGSPSASPSASGTLSPFQQAQAWFASVQDIFTSIQQDTEAIKIAAGKQDTTSVRNACEALQTDNKKAQLAPAPPNELMIVAVGSATDAYAKAAQACLTGDYATTATEIDQGAAYLSRANEIMNNMN